MSAHCIAIVKKKGMGRHTSLELDPKLGLISLHNLFLEALRFYQTPEQYKGALDVIERACLVHDL